MTAVHLNASTAAQSAVAVFHLSTHTRKALALTTMPRGVAVRCGMAIGGSSAVGGAGVESDALPHVWVAAR